MTQTIIPGDQTGPDAPAAPDSQSEIPAKFQNEDGSLNTDALLKSYHHLESKLGSQGAQDAAVHSDQNEPTTETTVSSDSDTTNDPYGPVVSSAMKQAGLSEDEVSRHFMENGTISDDHYASLEKAGFSRDVVDVYLGGLTAKQHEVEGVAEADIKAVKDAIGGETEYAKMQAWAAKNLSEADLASFNAAVSTGNKDTAMWAVQGLYAQFIGKTGSNPTFVRGAGGDDGAAGFGSKHELVTAMKDPRYGKDPAYTAEVERRVAKSSIFQRKG